MATKLKKGERWTTKDRMYLIVGPNGRPACATPQVAAVYFRRKDAKDDAMEGEHVIRLADLHGEVV